MTNNDGTGIHGWMLSIRASMANDPCRQLFEDQVQTHAFLFLDDYLENIIAGPQQAPIIDLVKTPGRKKNVPRRPKAAPTNTAKLLEFEPQAYQDSPLEVPVFGRRNDLSIIAEGDESPEHSFIAAPPIYARQSGMDMGTCLQPEKSDSIFPTDVHDTIHADIHTESVLETNNVSAPSSANTFHSVALDSPDQVCSRRAPTDHNQHPSPHIASPPPPASLKETITTPDLTAVSERGPFLDTIVISLNDSEPQNTASRTNISQFPTLPAPSPLRKSIRSPTETTDNGLPSTTPALPPMGKRTSWLMKAREAKAMEGGVTRSGTLSSVHFVDSYTPDTAAMPASTKRKSSEMLGNPLHGKTGERKSKILKMMESDTAAPSNMRMEKEADQEQTPHMSIPLPARASKPSDGNDLEDGHPASLNDEEGFIRQFKRTVEGLGARACKNTTKSLGGAAAALAEARAAAEARVAERNKVNDEIHNPENFAESSSTQPSLPHQGEHFTSAHSTGSGEQRLSISDLAARTEPINNEEDEIYQVSSMQSCTIKGEQFMSTTPPNSPHRTMNFDFVKTMGPVFTKQPALTILGYSRPTTAAHPKEISFSATAGTFTLPASMTLGAPGQIMSPNSGCKGYLEDGERTLDPEIVSHIPNMNEPDDLERLERDSIDSLDLEDSMMDTGELGAQSTVTPTETAFVRSSSQLSVMSTASSSQSETGFFGQATKLVTSMLGGGKKAKPEVKSLQLAAAAAKKQQGEADKKALRLKEMEARRQAALARKLEEERLRVLEEEKKVKEESERRKRDREENTDKRPLKLPVTAAKKVEEETTKKRKIAVDTEKKMEAKKLAPKDQKDPAPVKPVKSNLTTPATKTTAPPKSVKSATTALVSSAAYNATQNVPIGTSSAKPAIPEAKPFKLAPVSLMGKGKAKAQEDGDKQPSAMVQTQMAARAKAQIQASKQVPEVPSESIELPEINSEYSDSEDEDRARTFDPPGWAQSPELRQALQMQSTVNPDDVFGAIRPLRMEEMFRTRQSRFRARTSSANWSGADRLTVEEIREYERRMGFRPQAS
ncbi:hypothetical protein J3A83DRAFT_3311215 [Scleroderma citrinum]